MISYFVDKQIESVPQSFLRNYETSLIRISSYGVTKGQSLPSEAEIHRQD